MAYPQMEFVPLSSTPVFAAAAGDTCTLYGSGGQQGKADGSHRTVINGEAATSRAQQETADPRAHSSSERGLSLSSWLQPEGQASN